jgi:hypothetical protein
MSRPFLVVVVDVDPTSSRERAVQHLLISISMIDYTTQHGTRLISAGMGTVRHMGGVP